MRFPIFLSAVLVLTACGATPKPSAEVGADSAAALPASSGVSSSTAGAMRPDSLATAADSAGANAGAVTATTTDPKAPTKSKAPSGIIGRDSAFGPIGEVDASGKITPIPTKKP